MGGPTQRRRTAVAAQQLVVPERFAVKQFADPNFNVDSHVADQLAAFRRRIAKAEHKLPDILTR